MIVREDFVIYRHDNKEKMKLTSVQNEHPHCEILVIFSDLYSPRHNLHTDLLDVLICVRYVDPVAPITVKVGDSGTTLLISICCCCCCDKMALLQLLLLLLLLTGMKPPPDKLSEYLEPAANDKRLEQREQVAIEPQFRNRLSGRMGPSEPELPVSRYVEFVSARTVSHFRRPM